MSTVVVFLLVFAVISAFLVYTSRGSLVLKTVLLVLLFYSASAIYYSFDSYRGWPTDTRNKRELVVLSVVIFEKTREDPGAIYVTGIPCAVSPMECLKYAETDTVFKKLSPFKVFGYVPPAANTPRLYEFPYTEENRQKFAAARENIKNGGVSIVEGSESEESSSAGQESGDKSKAESGSDAADGQKTEKRDPNAVKIDNLGPEDLLRKNPQ